MLKKIKTHWFKLSDKIRFLLIGMFNFCMSYLIYSGLMYFILGEKYYQLSLALSWVISSVISFATQRNLVFKGMDSIFKEYAKCCITWFFSYLINAFLLWLLVQKLFINPYLGQIIATGFCALFNYMLFKTFAFKKSEWATSLLFFTQKRPNPFIDNYFPR